MCADEVTATAPQGGQDRVPTTAAPDPRAVGAHDCPRCGERYSLDGCACPTATAATEPPVRLCCFQRHAGVVCPDGKVMCCQCFGRFAVADLFTYPGDDMPSDVCKPCGEADSVRA